MRITFLVIAWFISAGAADPADSLLIERLTQLSRSEKQVVMDSLLNNNRRYARKIQ